MNDERPDPMLHAPSDPIARRDFMKRMGAALALAGAGCTRAPAEEIVPYVHQPPEVRPSKSRTYASSFVLDGLATGILVETHEGRPTKIEGNPEHPASLGAAGAFEQASLLGLYDPDRMRVKRSAQDVAEEISRGIGEDGRGLAIVLAETSSPSMEAMLAALRKRWPALRVWFHGATTAPWEGARLAFGRVLEPRYDLHRAEVVLTLDADLLARGRASLRHARHFADGRRVTGPGSSMNRLWAVEPIFTATGIAADHRLRVRAHDVVAIAAAVLSELGVADLAIPPALASAVSGRAPFVRALAHDLAAHRGRSVVVAGDSQPAVVHALAHVMNDALGNVGATVTLAPSPIVEAGEPSHDLRGLAAALGSGEIDTLLVLGPNLVYASPADLDFGALVRRARQSLSLGAYDDETARACKLTLPEAHVLESWGDARAFDGTVSLVQPVIEPLFGGKTALDVLAALDAAGSPRRPAKTAHDLVRDALGARLGAGADLERTWRQALRRGMTEEPGLAAVAPPTIDRAAVARALADVKLPAPDAIELVARPDERVHDGRFANNAWLLELPTVVSKLTWTNAATMSPATAARLGVGDNDVIELDVRGRKQRAPAHVVPGFADGSIALTLGWGRDGAEENARGRGTNAFELVTTDAPTMIAGVAVMRTGERHELALTQATHGLFGRDREIARHGSLADYVARPREKKRGFPLPLYDHAPSDQHHQWGMAIDLTVCTGCSACLVACQAENNVPTVGADGVIKGRVMHWLRVDTYFDGEEVVAQPMLCQHCEKAPCEYVCPVNATVHSEDGMNQMIYNRCVGTRFCSNNCPYKVRRFNWFDYHQHEEETEQLAHNPDVTVRQRGVMEKCSFCVQRIREHEIHGRPLQTACQQACPTGAIVFGDLLAKDSRVARMHASDRAYGALEELGTKPRVLYLERLKNKVPEAG